MSITKTKGRYYTSPKKAYVILCTEDSIFGTFAGVVVKSEQKPTAIGTYSEEYNSGYYHVEVPDPFNEPITKRYFLVAYRSEGGAVGMVQADTNGVYPNTKAVLDIVKRHSPHTTDIAITNIMELSESDYNDFTPK